MCGRLTAGYGSGAGSGGAQCGYRCNPLSGAPCVGRGGRRKSEEEHRKRVARSGQGRGRQDVLAWSGSYIRRSITTPVSLLSPSFRISDCDIERTKVSDSSNKSSTSSCSPRSAWGDRAGVTGVSPFGYARQFSRPRLARPCRRHGPILVYSYIVDKRQEKAMFMLSIGPHLPSPTALAQKMRLLATRARMITRHRRLGVSHASGKKILRRTCLCPSSSPLSA